MSETKKIYSGDYVVTTLPSDGNPSGNVTIITNTLKIIGNVEGNITGNGGSASLLPITRYTESKTNVTAASTTTIDCGLSNIYVLNLGASIATLTLSNVVASGTHYNLTLYVVQGGSYTISWPGTLKWANSFPPVITTGAGNVDVITMSTYNGGTTWYGFVAGQNFS